jgi:succinate dehydrogenase / fumarate reductase cytochrome b subunit
MLTIKEALRYRGKEGQLAWIGQRLAGLGTLLFFTTHVIDTSWVYFWPEGYGHAIDIYRNPIFQIGELLLVLAVIYHGLNGLRITLLDMRPGLWKHEKLMAWTVFVLTAALFAPAAYLMGGHALKNLYGIHLPGVE